MGQVLTRWGVGIKGEEEGAEQCKAGHRKAKSRCARAHIECYSGKKDRLILPALSYQKIRLLMVLPSYLPSSLSPPERQDEVTGPQRGLRHLPRITEFTKWKNWSLNPGPFAGLLFWCDSFVLPSLRLGKPPPLRARALPPRKQFLPPPGFSTTG